eukprot:scaffold5041_cov85-Phaeocystis_antarctica.AAC.7
MVAMVATSQKSHTVSVEWSGRRRMVNYSTWQGLRITRHLALTRTGTLQVSEFAHRCRCKAHAEWSGALSHGYGKVSDTRGLHKDPALANWSQNFTPWA